MRSRTGENLHPVQIEMDGLQIFLDWVQKILDWVRIFPDWAQVFLGGVQVRASSRAEEAGTGRMGKRRAAAPVPSGTSVRLAGL